MNNNGGLACSTVAVILSILCLLVAVYALAYAVSRKSCYAQTSQMGFATTFDFWGGCRIEVKPGQWIPLDNYYYRQP